MRKTVLSLTFMLLSSVALAGPYDSEPGTRAYTIPTEQLQAANLRDCCDGQKPKGDSVIVMLDHSKVPNGAPYRGNMVDRSSSY